MVSMAQFEKGIATFYGLSTDTKPTKMADLNVAVNNMAIFVEMDTGDAYYYNKDTEDWEVLGGDE